MSSKAKRIVSVVVYAVAALPVMFFALVIWALTLSPIVPPPQPMDGADYTGAIIFTLAAVVAAAGAFALYKGRWGLALTALAIAYVPLVIPFFS